MLRQSLKPLCLTAALAAPAPLLAEDLPGYVVNNVLATLYHELGHALIDIEAVPIFGQEEDAADVLSVLLIDAFWVEEDASALIYDTATSFALAADETGPDVAWWDDHGPDLQRYYNTVCLFYGADPEAREDIAEELGLPEERAEYCDVEFEQAADAWGGVLDEIAEGAPAQTLRLGDFALEDEVAAVLEAEVDALNQDFALSSPVSVSYAPCGEANAFYDPELRDITICTEFVDYLLDQSGD